MSSRRPPTASRWSSCSEWLGCLWPRERWSHQQVDLARCASKGVVRCCLDLPLSSCADGCVRMVRCVFRSKETKLPVRVRGHLLCVCPVFGSPPASSPHRAHPCCASPPCECRVLMDRLLKESGAVAERASRVKGQTGSLQQDMQSGQAKVGIRPSQKTLPSKAPVPGGARNLGCTGVPLGSTFAPLDRTGMSMVH